MNADAVELAIFRSAVHSIAEEMGAALRRTALSPNIKERRDYSCALFDGEARVIAMGDHMPVHLGSMPMSVEAAVAAIDFAPGDVAVLNDPYAGERICPTSRWCCRFFCPERRRLGSMYRRGRTMRMWADRFLARWGRRERFSRKGCGFLRCASCGEGRLTARCWT